MGRETDTHGASASRQSGALGRWARLCIVGALGAVLALAGVSPALGILPTKRGWSTECFEGTYPSGNYTYINLSETASSTPDEPTMTIVFEEYLPEASGAFCADNAPGGPNGPGSQPAGAAWATWPQGWGHQYGFRTQTLPVPGVNGVPPLTALKPTRVDAYEYYGLYAVQTISNQDVVGLVGYDGEDGAFEGLSFLPPEGSQGSTVTLPPRNDLGADTWQGAVGQIGSGYVNITGAWQASTGNSWPQLSSGALTWAALDASKGLTTLDCRQLTVVAVYHLNPNGTVTRRFIGWYNRGPMGSVFDDFHVAPETVADVNDFRRVQMRMYARGPEKGTAVTWWESGGVRGFTGRDPGAPSIPGYAEPGPLVTSVTSLGMHAFLTDTDEAARFYQVVQKANDGDWRLIAQLGFDDMWDEEGSSTPKPPPSLDDVPTSGLPTSSQLPSASVLSSVAISQLPTDAPEGWPEALGVVWTLIRSAYNWLVGWLQPTILTPIYAFRDQLVNAIWPVKWIGKVLP